MLLNIKNLTVCYDRKVALDNACLEVCENDFIGITGPNGGGKTTLVKAIIGLVPYEGTIEYSDRIGKTQGSIGYLPQINNFDRAFPISAREVVMSGLQSAGKFTGRLTKQEKLKGRELMELAGISDAASKPIGELSGGQIQRALLCRALISDPAILILDEPTNFVDSKFETELYGILKQLNDRMAIIMVSHDVGELIRLVKKIVCVNRTIHCHSPLDYTHITEY